MSRLKQAPSTITALPAAVQSAPKLTDDFYRSREWLQLVAEIKRERGNFCARCGADGRKVRIIADHIHEIRDGGSRLDKNNVELLCSAHHNTKTAAARSKRALGET